LANQRRHPAITVQRDTANRTDLAVSHVERLAIGGQSAGLCEQGTAQRAVADVLRSSTRPVGDIAALEAHLPDLMIAGHGNEQFVAMPEQVPRAVQADILGRTTVAALVALFAIAGDGLHRALFQVEGTDNVVLAIRDIKRVALEGEALGVVELSLGKG